MKRKLGIAKFPIGIVMALLFVLITWSLLILLCGENPISTFGHIIQGAFKNGDKVNSVVNKLFLFFFAALAFCIPSWTGMFNVGGDGQLIIGGFFAASLPLFLNTGIEWLNITLALIVSMIAGGLWALWPALLRVKYNINEVVTTLLGNYIIIYLTEYMVNFPLRSKGSSVPRVDYIPDNFKFPTIGGSSLSATVILVILALVIVEFYRRKMISGYQYKITGENIFLAKQGGIAVDLVRVRSMVVGGMLAGLGGGLLVLSISNTFQAGFSSDYGLMGMLVALISGSLPLIALVITAVFAILQVGAINMQVLTSIPSEITGVMQSVIVFFITARGALNFRKKGFKR